MRRTILTIGLLMVLVGIFTLTQDPHFLSSIAQASGLASHSQTETSILSPTLLAVPPSNYTFLPANLNGNVQVQGSFEVANGYEVAFYVMDQGNFSQWRAGHPSAIILARPTAVSYNFTFTPTTSGTYYFVFDNQDTTRRVVIFSLNAVESVTLLNPIIQFASYEILLVGILLSLLGIKSGKRKPVPPEIRGWLCKFCGAENPTEQAFCESCGRSQR